MDVASSAPTPTQHHRSVRLDVAGLPPKKDGASSMWGKPLERDRLIALRLAAVAALGDAAPPRPPLSLRLVLYADPCYGDLDSFITGICDGLMRSRKIDAADWPDIHPAARLDRDIIYTDDSVIWSITAERQSSDLHRYELEIASLEVAPPFDT